MFNYNVFKFFRGFFCSVCGVASWPILQTKPINQEVLWPRVDLWAAPTEMQLFTRGGGGGVGFQPHFRKNIIFVRNMFLCMKIVNPYSHCLLLWKKGHCLCITSGPHAGGKGRTLDPHKLQAYYNITSLNGQLQPVGYCWPTDSGLAGTSCILFIHFYMHCFVG